jgi:predicted dehydrogenase
MTKNFAIIGCGHIGQRHFHHIQKHPLGRVHGVFDVDNQVLSDFGLKNSVHTYSSLDELLQDPDVDIVNICTSNGTHSSLAIQVMESGKDVLVEKPMAISVESAQSMLESAKKTNQNLFVVKQNRYNPPVAEVKKLMDENRLGKVLMVSVNCFWNRNAEYYKQSPWRGTKELDGGVLYTQFSHFIDILYYLFGEISASTGYVANLSHGDLIEFEDSGTFSFTFKNGALGNLAFTTSAFRQNMEGSITIFAENATIKIGGKYLNTIDYQVTDGFDIAHIPISSPANNYGFYEGSMSNHDKVIDNVIETLNGRQKIMTTGSEGLKVVEMIGQLYDSAKMNM